ncbi:MAG: helix-turn-helix domain-containing protein [Parabacteroides sp.]
MTETEPEQESEEGLQLFRQLDAYIRNERLFLQPEVDLDALTERFSLSKSRFMRLVRSHTDGNFSEYLNNLRLDYSLQLMRENPRYTIDAIAEESGFHARRSYYRLFRNRYGVTPQEYRKKVINQSMNFSVK